MKKILLFLVLIVTINVSAQSTTWFSKPLELETVPASTSKSDSVLVRGTDKIVKYLPISEIKSITNLDYLATPTGGTVFSSSGNDASVPLATTVNAGLFSPADKAKLNGIAVGATANDTDANLKNRANHTGSQAISTVVGLQAAIDAKLNLSLVNANNGVAPLDAGGKVPFANLPASLMIYKGMWNPSTNTPTLSDASGTVGWVYKTNAAGTANLGSGNQTFFNGDFLIHNGTKWERSAGTDAVVSVNGQQGIVTLSKNDIGLGSVDNTSDLNKPISTATQTALNLKANDASVVHRTGNLGESINGNKTFTNSTFFDGIVNLKQVSGIGGANEGYASLAGLTTGFIFSVSNTKKFSFLLDNLTGARNYLLPDKAGTFALTSDIPTNVITGTGTSGKIPLYSDTTVIGDSSISEFANRVAVSAKPLLVTGGFGIGFQLEDGFKITREIGHTAFFYDNIKKMELSTNGLLLNNLSVTGSVTSKENVASNFMAVKGNISSFPATGSGLELLNSSATASIIQSYDRGNSTYNDILIRGSNISLLTNTAERVKVNPAGDVTIGGGSASGKLNIFTGYGGNSFDLANQQDGGFSFSNAASSTSAPTMSAKTNTNGGLFIISGTPDNNNTADMNFGVRRGTDSDFTTLTKTAFRFNRYNTVLIDILRNGDATFTGSIKAKPATVDTELATWGQAKAVSRPYKVYTFIINQVGTGAPTVAILENTLGGTPVWTRTSTGSNFCTLSGAFPVGKVFCSITSGNNTAFYSMYEIGPNQVTLKTFNNTGVFTDSMLTQASGEIRVYP